MQKKILKLSFLLAIAVVLILNVKVVFDNDSSNLVKWDVIGKVSAQESAGGTTVYFATKKTESCTVDGGANSSSSTSNSSSSGSIGGSASTSGSGSASASASGSSSSSSSNTTSGTSGQKYICKSNWCSNKCELTKEEMICKFRS